ncbi:GGDEF domain-containing response regulator [Leptolyngbya sp. 'hensonii']|uniref:two-component system response regulator n=1 Tax=Leptolyngbya sp. 'hensonii' TaxID=1922337 RepID=UPI00094FF5C1|nr:GGDEF domain-containing response regulator [Leptolyngbya sp. 'hensonii']OLP18410.1 GGDEF domain-containing response regulator [Leptolyngbya sp. 'hensonii']
MNNNRGRVFGSDILIVDDTPDNLRVLSDILTQAGYQVRKAMNGTMALKAIQSLQPDLILLDIMMPDMNGYEVCQKLKADPHSDSVPVIFLSALDDVLDKVRAFEVGGVDYITKPFYVEEVLVRVQNQLQLKAAEQEIRLLNTHLEEKVRERTQELELANARLLTMALRDDLTGLANRVLFMQSLEQSLSQAKTDPDYRFAVLFLDCDRFKTINDSLGHMVGDELLVAAARRLEALLDSSATLARLNGDEFAILLQRVTNAAQATHLAEQILALFASPFQLSRHEVFVSFSIGIATGHSNYEEPEHVMRDADIAMYRAKAAGKAQYQVFDTAMHAETFQAVQIEMDLRRAVEQQEFILHYQPIVAVNTGRIVGFEALARWQHPQWGLITPNQFIPIAEETGIIAAIGHQIIREACHQLRHWQDEGLLTCPLVMSVNLSARQLIRHTLIEQVDEILAETGINPMCLKMELTESAIMENPQLAAGLFQELQERGIQLSIDDFGTGYSSLSYLYNLPMDTLKIDRSFISNVDVDGEKLELVRTIVNLAWNLGMDVVAEGVETAMQLAQLKSLRCDYAQGYLFSRPLPVADARELLKRPNTWLASPKSASTD